MLLTMQRHLPTFLMLMIAACPLPAQPGGTTMSEAEITELAAKETELEALLERYVGRWVGRYEVKNIAKQVIQRLEVEQQYWWEYEDNDRILKGQAVIASMGTLSYSQSKSFVDIGKVYSETESNGAIHYYVGHISNNGNTINWLDVGTQDKLANKLTDTFEIRPEGEYLVIEGYGQISDGTTTGILVINGELRRVSKTPLELESPKKEPVEQQLPRLRFRY